MDAIEAAADHCIRRALGFAGLAIGTVMLALSYDIALALRSAGDLVAICAGVLIFAAWKASNSDPRDSETWTILMGWRPDFARSLPKPDARRMLATALRRRLIWHAERVSVLALALWLLLGLVELSRL